MRRSAWRPIITPIMSCPIGPRPWSSRPMSACISSTAGAAAGAGRPPSPPAYSGPSPRSPGAAASASRSGGRQAAGRAAATPAARRGRSGDRHTTGPQHASVDSFQRCGAAPLRAAPARHRQAVIAERTRADPNMTNSNRWALTGDGSGPPQAPARPPLQARPGRRASCRASAIAGIRAAAAAAARRRTATRTATDHALTVTPAQAGVSPGKRELLSRDPGLRRGDAFLVEAA